MRFFTSDWIDGSLGESDAQDRERAYRDHCASIWSRFTPAVRKLALEVDLHDGVIEQVTVRRADGSARLVVVNGDLQRGYSTAVLDYSGIPDLAAAMAPLKLAAGSGVAEILASEVDVSPHAPFVHRFVLIDLSEVGIPFSDLTVSVEPCSDRPSAPDVPRWSEE